MDKETDIFQKKYATESSTNTLSKPTEEKEEEQQQNQTVSGQIGYYDKSKPYRVIIRAKEVKG